MRTTKKTTLGISALILVFALIFASCGGGGGGGGIPHVGSLALADVPSFDFTADHPDLVGVDIKDNIFDSSELADVIFELQLAFWFVEDFIEALIMEKQQEYMLANPEATSGSVTVNLESDLTNPQKTELEGYGITDLKGTVRFSGGGSGDPDSTGSSWMNAESRNISFIYTFEDLLKASFKAAGGASASYSWTPTTFSEKESESMALSVAAAFDGIGAAGKLIMNFGYFFSGSSVNDTYTEDEPQVGGNIAVFGKDDTPVLTRRDLNNAELQELFGDSF